MGLADRGLAAELAGMREMILSALQKGTPEATGEAEGMKMLYQLASPDAATWSPERWDVWQRQLQEMPAELRAHEQFDNGVWADELQSQNNKAYWNEWERQWQKKLDEIGPENILPQPGPEDHGFSQHYKDWDKQQFGIRQEVRALMDPFEAQQEAAFPPDLQQALGWTDDYNERLYDQQFNNVTGSYCWY